MAISDTEQESGEGAAFLYYLKPRKNVAAAMAGTSYENTPNQAFRHNGRAGTSYLDGHVSSDVPGEFGTTGYALLHNIGFLGGNDAPYLVTRQDFEEMGIALDGKTIGGE